MESQNPLEVSTKFIRLFLKGYKLVAWDTFGVISTLDENLELLPEILFEYLVLLKNELPVLFCQLKGSARWKDAFDLLRLVPRDFLHPDEYNKIISRVPLPELSVDEINAVCEAIDKKNVDTSARAHATQLHQIIKAVELCPADFSQKIAFVQSLLPPGSPTGDLVQSCAANILKKTDGAS